MLSFLGACNHACNYSSIKLCLVEFLSLQFVGLNFVNKKCISLSLVFKKLTFSLRSHKNEGL